MYRLFALVALACSAAAAPPPQPVSLSPAVQKDVRCFFLLAAAVGTADKQQTKEAASIGVAYYYGRLQVAAPGLDLVQAVRQEVTWLEKEDPAEARKIGAACDAEIAALGNELITFGDELQASGD